MPDMDAAHPAVHAVVKHIDGEMRRRKISQESMAMRSGVDRAVLSRLRRGIGRAKIDDLEALANLLGFTIRMQRIVAARVDNQQESR